LAIEQSLKVYGFGSFFLQRTRPARDIDLLLLHRDVGLPSVEFAIRCKSLITAIMPYTHIVMLSEAEECDLDFLGRSNGLLLRKISDARLSSQIERLAAEIARLN